MGARDFEAGSSNLIRTSVGTVYSGLGTAHSHAMICTVESLPGTFYVGVGLSVSTPSPTVVIALDAGNSGSITYAIAGVSLAAPSAPMIPPLDTPLLIVCAKAAGTVACRFLMHNYATSTTTYDSTGSTVANRTPGNAFGVIGDQDGSGIPWDGWIGAAGQWNRALSEGEMRALIGGRSAWKSSFGRGALSNNAEFFVDLTQPGTIRDQFNPSIEWTSGTQPAFAPEAFRWPGW